MPGLEERVFEDLCPRTGQLSPGRFEDLVDRVASGGEDRLLRYSGCVKRVVAVAVLASFFACQEKGAKAPAPSPGPQVEKRAARAMDAGPASVDARALPDAAVAREGGLVELRALVPDVVFDMRYATTQNFTKKAVYEKALCLVRKEVAEKLVKVQATLRDKQLKLLVWDCYRPFAVQEAFWKLVDDPRYVARPIRGKDGKPKSGSRHNRGAAVDVGVVALDGTAVELPTDHDDFSRKAHRSLPGASAEARRNANALERAMLAAGFVGLPSEWWHYDAKGWQRYPLLDEPL